MRPLLVATLIVLAPTVALAAGPAGIVPGNPGNPGDSVNNPHPTMPWVGITTPYGQLIRYVWVPAQEIVLDTGTVEVPGYWAAETTVGYYYPEHWVLEPTGDTYRWVLAPRRFQRR
jgi:hypothetical protein